MWWALEVSQKGAIRISNCIALHCVKKFASWGALVENNICRLSRMLYWLLLFVTLHTILLSCAC